MGRWKPKTPPPPERERAPVPRPPLHTALTTLLEPIRAQLDRPGHGLALATLAHMAAVAWNLSRLEQGPPSDTLTEFRAAWAGLVAAGDDAAAVAEVLLAHARQLDPGDPRLMVRAHAAIRRGVFVVEVDAVLPA